MHETRYIKKSFLTFVYKWQLLMGALFSTPRHIMDVVFLTDNFLVSSDTQWLPNSHRETVELRRWNTSMCLDPTLVSLTGQTQVIHICIQIRLYSWKNPVLILHESYVRHVNRGSNERALIIHTKTQSIGVRTDVTCSSGTHSDVEMHQTELVSQHISAGVSTFLKRKRGVTSQDIYHIQTDTRIVMAFTTAGLCRLS